MPGCILATLFSDAERKPPLAPSLMTATQEPPARRAVALRPTRRTVLLAAVALSAWFFMLPRLWEPVYQGKRIGAWFDDLCSGVFPGHDAKKWSAASRAFSRMDSNAVPFLVKQLTYDQRGTVERLELSARRVPLVSQVAMLLVLPSEKRSYAAVALKNMGTNAVSAVEPMLLALQREPQRAVRMNIVMALAPVIGCESFTDPKWQEFEHTFLERVRRRREAP
jgi:hypothetical protein